MRIRSNDYYIEHGMPKTSPGLAGRWWRAIGLLVVGVTWVIAAWPDWEMVLRVWSGLMAAIILVAAWLVAAWFDEEDRR